MAGLDPAIHGLTSRKYRLASSPARVNPPKPDVVKL